MKALTLSIATFGLLLLVGCSSETPQSTPDQKKAFLGGPMPPEFQQKQQEMMKKAAESAQKAQQEAQKGAK